MKATFLHIEEREGVNIITLTGMSFDPEQISKINTQISSLIEQGKINFIVDMGNLHIMNSTVSSILVVSLKKARAAGGNLILANVPVAIQRQLDTARLTTIFSITETVEQAREKLKAQPNDF